MQDGQQQLSKDSDRCADMFTVSEGEVDQGRDGWTWYRMTLKDAINRTLDREK